MQKYTRLYGLTIECSPDQHEKHQDIQAMLSEHFNEAKRAIDKNSYRGICANAKPINNKGQNLAFIITHRNLYLGIYDENSKTLSDHCSLDDITDKYVEHNVKRMSCMIQNYAKSGISMEKDTHDLLKAWGHELVRRQLLANQENRIEAKKADIFTKPMGELLKDASDRVSDHNSHHQITPRQKDMAISR